MKHWAEKYIGIPYVHGGQTPEGFDCWGLFRFVQKEYFNTELPFIDIDSTKIRTVAKTFNEHEERNNWVQIEKPKLGDAVLMAHARYPSHVGVWLNVNGGGVLHCVKGIGVIFSTIANLKLSGWGRIEFYEYSSR